MTIEPRSRPLLDIAGAASYLGLTERQTRRIIGHLVRFDPDELDRYVESRRVEAVR